MKENMLPIKLTEQKEITEENPLLVIGYDESVIKTLPKGTHVIDPSMSKTNEGYHKFSDKVFLTKDLSTFSLGRKFANIVSCNTLHLEKNLEGIMNQIHDHLEDEAFIYFPLSPPDPISKYLETEEVKPHLKPDIKQNTRTDVEEAALSAPFASVLIEEKKENISFFSEDDLASYIKGQLKNYTNYENEELEKKSKELSAQIYKIHDKDKVLSLSSPWIFLTLSNYED